MTRIERFAFTLIELLIVISIIAMLCAILFPALAKAKHRVEDTVCKSNCKQIGVALAQYSSDFNDWHLPGKIPYIDYWSGSASDRPWFEALGKFGPYSQLDYGVRVCSLGNTFYDPNNAYHAEKGKRIFCPSQKINNLYVYSDYAANQRLFGIVGTYPTHKLTQITQPATAKEIFDNARKNDYGVSYITDTAGGDIYVNLRHDKRTNVLYSEGHVSSKNFQDLTSLGSHSGATELLEGF